MCVTVKVRQDASWCVRTRHGASGDNCDKLEFVRVTATGTSGGIAIVQVWLHHSVSKAICGSLPSKLDNLLSEFQSISALECIISHASNIESCK